MICYRAATKCGACGALVVVVQIVTCDTPAHMYFDIEFSRAANPGVEGSRLVAEVIDMVKQLFR